MWDFGHRVNGFELRVYNLGIRDANLIMENHMEKKMKNELETEGI